MLHKQVMQSKFYSPLSYFKLMLFIGKTVALPQQSISCQVFVRQQYQYAALFLLPLLFSSFIQKELLNV